MLNLPPNQTFSLSEGLCEFGSYFDSESLGGFGCFVAHGVGYGNFATHMHCGLGVSLGASSPDPTILGGWLLCLATIIGISVGIKSLVSKKPTHSELATKEELKNYVRESEFRDFKTEVRGDMGEIKALISGAVSKVEDYAEKSYQARKHIHQQVNRIDRGLTKVETVQQEQEKQIHRLQDHA